MKETPQQQLERTRRELQEEPDPVKRMILEEILEGIEQQIREQEQSNE